MIGHDDDLDGEEFEEQLEQLLMENGILLHALMNLLVSKGILNKDEIEKEVERLYQEVDEFAEDETNGRE